jgi:hypothetical protein
MAAHIDDISVNYEEDGVVLVKELDRIVLSKGAWTTIIFKYQDWDAKKDAYSPNRYTIRRYQKKNNEYKQRSKFNISSDDQAKKIIESLTGWLNETATA